MNAKANKDSKILKHLSEEIKTFKAFKNFAVPL